MFPDPTMADVLYLIGIMLVAGLMGYAIGRGFRDGDKDERK